MTHEMSTRQLAEFLMRARMGAGQEKTGSSDPVVVAASAPRSVTMPAASAPRSAPQPSSVTQPTASAPGSESKKEYTSWDQMPKREWGPRAWHWLHNMAITYSDNPSLADKQMAYRRIHKFIEGLPCEECRRHSIQYISAVPPDYTDSHTLQIWVWTFHNSVNKRLGHPIFTLEEYKHMYLSERCWAHWSADECK